LTSGPSPQEVSVNQEGERRLVAILSADAVGYSRLMGDDEAATVATLDAYRGVFRGLIESRKGRVVDTAGDSVLAVFPSVVEAVECAVAVQEDLAARNDALAKHRRMPFRIGVNLGDIIAKPDGTVYGDGVNIAARLESIADGGGVCISGNAYDFVDGKLDLSFEFLGEQQVKNIAKPVPAYRVTRGAGETIRPSVGKGPPVPDKPSIAVLPFDNMSGDPEQEYFSDGITEDIITELSRFRSLFVIARNSTFTYKGRSVRVQEVAKDLGVQYVLEGSVRKAGKRVRVTAQLVDASNGQHIWAERFDRDLEDVFALQDEITQMIVAALPRRLEAAGLERAKRKPTDNLVAYDYLLRGKDYHHQRTAEANAECLRMFDKAIELDPGFGQAYAWRACGLGQAYIRGYIDTSDTKFFAKAMADVTKSHDLDDDDPECHRLLCELNLLSKEHDKAEFHHERALALNPNDPRIVSQRGDLYAWLGRGDEGAEWVEKAMRLDPNHRGRWNSLGRALFVARRHDEAAKAFEQIRSPDYAQHAFLAGCYAEMDEDDKARQHAGEVRGLKPDFALDSYIENLHYKFDADREHHRAALRKAGLD
jgi:adenylate cyclase